MLENKSLAIMNKKPSEMFIISNEAVTSDKFPSSDVTIKIESDDVTEMEVDEVNIKHEQVEDKNDVIDDDEVKVSMDKNRSLGHVIF